MKVANVAELKNNLSKYLSLVEKGEEIEICKRNLSIAYIIPNRAKDKKNYTKLGCGKGSAIILDDLTKPLIPIKNWEMLKK